MDAKENVSLIIEALHEKNLGEKIHSQRITETCMQIGTALQLAPGEMMLLERAAFLHDIGKILMEDVSLKRSTPLTPEQWDEKKEHPQVGYELLVGYGEPKAVADAALRHHEGWNGSGYPGRLVGEAIPLFARIIAVAEYADALTLNSERMVDTDDNIIIRMKEQAGKRLDPTVVNAYLSVLE